MKTVQSKRNNDLLSFQLHLIIDFILTQRKLAHGPFKFQARSISHFAMNIIMAKTQDKGWDRYIYIACLYNVCPEQSDLAIALIRKYYTNWT